MTDFADIEANLSARCACGAAIVRFPTVGRTDRAVAFGVDPTGPWRLDPDECLMHRDAEHRWPEPRFRYRIHSCGGGAS